jgi:hypothetical protein
LEVRGPLAVRREQVTKAKLTLKVRPVLRGTEAMAVMVHLTLLEDQVEAEEAFTEEVAVLLAQVLKVLVEEAAVVISLDR